MTEAPNGRRKADAVNIAREHDERSTDHGFRFYGVVTLGNLISILPPLVLVLIWGLRLEGTVAQNALLMMETAKRLDARIDTQKQIIDLSQKQLTDTLADASKRTERIETLLESMGRDVTAVRIRLGVLKVDEPTVTQPFPRK